MRTLTLCALVLVSGCDGDAAKSGQERVATESQAAPARALQLQPITDDDLAKPGTNVGRCAFLQGGSDDMTASLGGDSGWFKLDGSTVTLAADKVAEEIDYGVRRRYADGKLSMELSMQQDGRKAIGPESQEIPGTLTIRDVEGREVYRASGRFQCAA